MLLDDVLSQLRSYGLIVDNLDTSGKLTHVKVEGNKGSKKSGWYVCWHNILPSGRDYINGAYGNYKISDDKQIISSESEGLTSDERFQLDDDRKRQKEKFVKIEAQRHADAVIRAKKIWEKLPLGGGCAYLDRKKVRPFGIRFGKDSIAIPVNRINDGELVGLQFIQSDGSKKFLTGTTKKGSCHKIGNWIHANDGQTVAVVEGYATGASVHIATGWPVAVCFDSGNLVSVLPELKQTHPHLKFIVAGDNDAETENNPGLKAAQKAAHSIRCPWGVPQFPPECSGFTDFNDLHVSAGLDVVKTQLTDVLANYDPSKEPPPTPPDDVSTAQRLTIEQCFNRFALISGTSAAWDVKHRHVIKKAALVDLIGLVLYRQWLVHEKRRTVSPRDLQRLQSKGVDGCAKQLDRYIYIYPTKDVWDMVMQTQIPLDVLKSAIPNEYPGWMKSPKRRIIDQANLVFDPTQTVDPKNHINRFTGLTLKRNNDHSRCFGIMQLLENICGHRPEVFEWVTRWLAYPLQHLGAKLDTALLIHSSQQGSGKSLLFADICCQLYGQYATVLGQHQLESQYTDWRSEILFGVFEEVLSRDQKYSHMGTVKHMISGKTQRIEKKFISGWEEANHLNAVFLSNEFQPFPIEPSDRRFLVVWPEQTLPEDIQQRAGEELKNGGLEAFYDFLMSYPLVDFNQHTKPIMTKEKKRLITFGLPSHEFFYEEWSNGQLNIPFVSCVITDIYNYYVNWCKEGNERALPRRKFTELFSVLPGLHRCRSWYNEGYTRKQARLFEVGYKPDNIKREQWLGDCVEKFREKSIDSHEC